VLAVDRFLSQFQQQLLGPLHDWCSQHREAVRGCFVPFPITGICVKVFIVSRAKQFDLSLSDAIADLEVKLQDTGWRCDILQIASAAPDGLRAFFDPEQSIQVFGDGNARTAPREG
jgi:hypothetical protein